MVDESAYSFGTWCPPLRATERTSSEGKTAASDGGWQQRQQTALLSSAIEGDGIVGGVVRGVSVAHRGESTLRYPVTIFVCVCSSGCTRWSFSGGQMGKKTKKNRKARFLFLKTHPVELSALRRCSLFKNLNNRAT